MLTDPVIAFGTTRIVFGARFSPRYGTAADPSVRIGLAQVAVVQTQSKPAPEPEEPEPETPTDEVEPSADAEEQEEEPAAEEVQQSIRTDVQRLEQSAASFNNASYRTESVRLECYSEASCYVPPETDNEPTDSGSGDSGSTDTSTDTTPDDPVVEPEGATAVTGFSATIMAVIAALSF